MTWRRALFLTMSVALAAGAYGGFIATPPGPRDVRQFDPERVADLEVAMWKAYYDKRNTALFMDLITLNRELHKCPRSTAALMAFRFSRAAAAFANLRSDYDLVLPDLEAGYRIGRDYSQLNYDPAAVAKAELAWWIARRIPGRNSPEQVGDLIAEANALFFGVSKARVLEASVLRARAGWLRDEGGLATNWDEVSRLLNASYRLLRSGVN